MAHDAFDLAEQFQTPVFVNSDLDLGMNNWMADPFEYPESRCSAARCSTQGRPRSAGRLRALRRRRRRRRRLPHAARHRASRAAYFTRGSGHNAKAGYTEKPADYVANVDRLARKFESIRAAVPAPVVDVRQERPHRHRLLRHLAIRLRGEPRPVARRIRYRDQFAAPAGLSLQRATRASSSRATTASTSSTRTATRNCSR